MHRENLGGVNAVVPGCHGAGVLGNRNYRICLFHAVFLDVVNPAAGICTGTVELRGVQVHHQGLSSGFLYFHTGQVGHPVVRMHHVKIIFAGHDGANLGELDDFAGQITGIQVFLARKEGQVCLVDTGEEQLALLGEGDVARRAFLAGVGVKVDGSLAHHSEAFVGVAFLQGLHLLVLQGIHPHQRETIVSGLRCCLWHYYMQVNLLRERTRYAHAGNPQTAIDERRELPSEF